MHGQGADVAAGEEHGIHGVGVCAHGQGAGDIQEGRVVHGSQDGVVERGQEHVFDQAGRSAAAATVVKEQDI